MIKHGVCGILSNNASAKEIIKAFDVVSKGECYYSKIAPKEMFDMVRMADFPVIMLPDTKSRFLEFCCSAMRYEEMAEKLELSYRTIDSYRDYFQHHFHLQNRSDIMMFALRTGLVLL
ncbi:MAG: response regulator transcription factor [Pedobacter sp.]|nr:MAG: response regulator transcription factor [Pedobacter sp.]